MTGPIRFAGVFAVVLAMAGGAMGATIDFNSTPNGFGGFTFVANYGEVVDGHFDTEYFTLNSSLVVVTSNLAADVMQADANDGIARANGDAWAEVRLTPETGYSLTLSSFVLKGNQESTRSVAEMRVYEIGSGSPSWTGTVGAGSPSGLSSSSGSFSPGPFSGLASEAGFRVLLGTADDLAIDDITFSLAEIVEPSAVPLPLAGWGALALLGIVGGMKAKKKSEPAA